MEIDERKRDGLCPTDVLSNEIDVAATLGVLISVIAYLVHTLLMNCLRHPLFDMISCPKPAQFQTKPWLLSGICPTLFIKMKSLHM